MGRDPGGALPVITGAPWLDNPATQRVFAALAEGGYAARAVGGVVRNALLGEPVTDIDIATPAPPEEVMRLAEAAGLRAVATGIAHGTVTVIAQHQPYEVTTLREDVETFGRHARVAFTADWQADARRRDFSMNALYCDAAGRVFDPVGGFPDLQARRVRFIGTADDRIREDYLRILRFFRFNASYGHGQLDSAGLAACVRQRHGLSTLSGERVRAELLKLLAARRASEIVTAMFAAGLLTEILAAVPWLGRFQRLVEHEARGGRPADAALRLAALAVHVEEDALRLFERLRLSGAERDLLVRAAASRAGRHAPDEPSARVLLYRLGEAAYRERLLLDWSVAADGADGGWQRQLELAPRWAVPALPVEGRDLLGLGMASGPAIGEALRQLETWWIDRDFRPSRDEMLAEARRRYVAG